MEKSLRWLELKLKLFSVGDPDRSPSRDLVILLFIAAVIFGMGLGLRHPWPADEPRYALIARDMVETGQWFFPSVGSELYPDKPPVFFWTIAAFYWLIGSMQIAFLLPPLLAGLGVVALVFDLARRLWDRQTAVVAAAALIVTAQFAEQARTAQIDMMLCLWTTLGIYGLMRHLYLGPSWGWYFVSFAAMGFGVITKGVGFLPVLMLLPYGYAVWRAWPGVTRGGGWRWLAGPVALLLAIGVWLIPMLWLVAASGDPEYVAYRDEILLKQTAERYASAWHHVKPPWYFLTNVIPIFWLPVAVVLPWAIPCWYRALRQADARILLLVGWIVLVLVFFSLSPGKRGIYILPALPATALAIAPYLKSLWDRRLMQGLAFAVTLFVAFVLAAAVYYYAVMRPEEGVELTRGMNGKPWAAVVTLSVAGVVWALVFGPRRGLIALSGFASTLWLIYGAWLFPIMDPMRSGERLIRNAQEIVDPGVALGLVGYREQFLLYLDRPVIVFGHRRWDSEQELLDAITWLAEDNDRQLLVGWREGKKNECIRQTMEVGFAHRENWHLLDLDGVDPACLNRGSLDAARHYQRAGAD